MSLPHMAFLVQSRPLHRSSCVHLWPNLHRTMDYFDNQAIAARFRCHNSPLKYSTIPLAISSYVAKQHLLREIDGEASEPKDVGMHSESTFFADSSHEGSSDTSKLNCHNEAVVTCSMEELKETLRRRIGMANKGRVPWNKGRKHTPETCARIKERTLEAMRDPKVRRKMSEKPRVHSEQSKKKIGSSLKQLWAKRLKLKRAKEKLYSSWAESVAEVARKGGINEEQLNWDSYEKLKKEIAYRRHDHNEEKAKETLLQRIQAAKRAQGRAQNMVSRAEKKLKDKGERRAKQKVTRKKSKEQIEDKKSIDGPIRSHSEVMSNLHSALEKLDIEFIKEEQRKTISLADLIQAAKNRRQILSKVDPQ